MKGIEWSFYENLDNAKADFNNLKIEWEKLKSTGGFKYADYTEDKLDEIEFMLNRSEFDDDMRMMKSLDMVNEIRKVHFTGKLKLSFILSFSNSSDKIIQFSKYCSELSDKEYWKNLSLAYTMQDYNEVPYEIVLALFNADKADKECLMDKEELDFLNDLPDAFTIYRAMTVKEKKSNRFRFSWTLKREVAEDFLERNSMLYDDEMTIHDIQVNKKDVVAYLNSRNEEEIIYLQSNNNQTA